MKLLMVTKKNMNRLVTNGTYAIQMQSCEEKKGNAQIPTFVFAKSSNLFWRKPSGK